MPTDPNDPNDIDALNKVFCDSIFPPHVVVIRTFRNSLRNYRSTVQRRCSLPGLQNPEDAHKLMSHQFQIYKELTVQALALIPFIVSLAVALFYVNHHLPPTTSSHLEHADANLLLVSLIAISMATVALAISLLLLCGTYHIWQVDNSLEQLKSVAQATELQLWTKATMVRASIILILISAILTGLVAAISGFFT